MQEIFQANLAVAFFGGLVSFFAPCAAILIPAFLSHLAGVSIGDLQKNKKKYRLSVFLNTLLFIFGFTFVFILLGASLGFLSRFIINFQEWINYIGGVIIIIFGLSALQLIKIPWPSSFQKLTSISSNLKYFSSFVVGAAFAIAWSPCVGPILGTILLIAGTSGTVSSGTYLLLTYSAGLTLPFLIVGLFTGWAAKFLSRASKLFKYFHYLAGILLIILGVLIFTGNFTRLVGYLYFLKTPI